MKKKQHSPYIFGVKKPDDVLSLRDFWSEHRKVSSGVGLAIACLLMFIQLRY